MTKDAIHPRPKDGAFWDVFVNGCNVQGILISMFDPSPIRILACRR
ncbi:MAG: hypothetical protein PVH02_19070 [Desulfobacteraceae bacterium]